MSDKDAREEAVTRKEVFVRMANAGKNPNMTVTGAALMLEQCFNEFLGAESQRTPPKIYKFPEAPESCPECDGTSFITAGGDNLICQVCFLSDKNDELEERIKQLESQRTQAPSETRTKLLKIAAKVARREYMPSLENCRTISDARIEVRRMDDLHAQLAWELKTVLDALAGTQAQAAQSDKLAPANALQWIDAKLYALRGNVEFGMTENGDVGVWIRGQEKCSGSGISARQAVENALKAEFVAPVAVLEGKP